ncbi:MAG: 3-phosphoshikimate 1-carboxyvinyltransferase [Legionella sp.]|nr:3-phosphoshikimate 1-carboxyvinyltransferase [Legionella sp.]
MHLISHPVYRLEGEITLPGDKSISHRAIILGAISKGQTLIEGCSMGEDCAATLAAFRAMGVVSEQSSSGALLIQGVGKYGLRPPSRPIDCGNSGTTMRLLAGILAAQPFDSILTGDESLQKRPMARIQAPLQKMGALINASPQHKAPLIIGGGQILRGIDYQMPVASAQVKSCLMLAGIYAQGITTLTEPNLTRNHTEKMFPLFGFNLKQQYLDQGLSLDIVKQTDEGKGTSIKVPGDFSSAAFFIVAATLIPQSTLILRNIGINETRIGLLQLLTQMGANIQIMNERHFGHEKVADLNVKSAALHGITISPRIIPMTIDELPILCIAAACAEGATEIRGAQELRFKESDRIESMAQALKQLGIDVSVLEDGLFIQGIGAQNRLEGEKVLDSFGDHRVAMSLAIAGALSKQPVSINHAESIATSFPNFLSIADQICLNIRENDTL